LKYFKLTFLRNNKGIRRSREYVVGKILISYFVLRVDDINDIKRKPLKTKKETPRSVDIVEICTMHIRKTYGS